MICSPLTLTFNIQSLALVHLLDTPATIQTTCPPVVTYLVRNETSKDETWPGKAALLASKEEIFINILCRNAIELECDEQIELLTPSSRFDYDAKNRR